MMRRALCAALIFFLMVQSTLGVAQQAQTFQQLLQEAQAVGAAANAAIQGNINTTTVQPQTPGFTATPPESALNPNSAALRNQAIGQLSACSQNGQDSPLCQATFVGGADASTRLLSPNMVSPTDPAVTAAKVVTGTPGSILGNITGTYSACVPNTTITTTSSTDEQSCYWYLLRTMDNACTKHRVVNVKWTCPEGDSGPLDDGTKYYCEHAVITAPATQGTDGSWHCPAGASGPTLEGTIASCTWTSPTPPANPLPSQTVKVVVDPSTPVVTETWSPECAGYEARVPAGLLLPDGDNSVPVGATPAPTGNPSKCVRTHSTCTDPFPITRVVDRVAVTESCWAYTNTFDCVEADPKSDCGQPRLGQCALKGNGCVNYDSLDPQFCNAIRNDYSCTTTTSKSNTVADCGGQTYTDPSGMVWPTGHPPSADFNTVVAGMEIAREAGMYGTNNAFFEGEDDRCDKKLFGLINCCNKSGTNTGALLNDLAVVGANALDYGSIFGGGHVSAYTYGSLFAGGSHSSWLAIGLEILMNSQFRSMILQALAGTLTTETFLSVMVPGPWSMLVILIIASGIFTCQDNEVSLGLKRDSGLCEDMGEYCSQSERLLFVSWCVVRTHTYCCFVSKLAKDINIGGKAQLGISMGNAEHPNCGGLTLSQLQQIDFSKIDLSDFMNSITCSNGSQAVPCDQMGTLPPALPTALPIGVQ